MATLKIAIAGASGRMGRALVEEVLRAPELALAAALEQKGNPGVGKDAGELVGSPCGVKIGDDARAIPGGAVLIDFTRPDGTVAHIAACRKQGTNMVIGTTGFSDAQKKEIAAAARGDIAIVMSPNFSVGVNVAFRLLDLAARSLGKGYDVEISEAHHRHKVDAPSGTALRM
ncbi:MAG TPA: 4-hydroxy-tetrahydrodipicolinate reductase, partial [Burkholderiales bacterium]|nr:4-hydroxy-tetrahydrodipicolinate reductase [Burkholderiales bacterium]